MQSNDECPVSEACGVIGKLQHVHQTFVGNRSRARCGRCCCCCCCYCYSTRLPPCAAQRLFRAQVLVGRAGCSKTICLSGFALKADINICIYIHVYICIMYMYICIKAAHRPCASVSVSLTRMLICGMRTKRTNKYDSHTVEMVPQCVHRAAAAVLLYAAQHISFKVTEKYGLR